ncbi:MAG: porin [Bryobacteraceae bacterium]
MKLSKCAAGAVCLLAALMSAQAQTPAPAQEQKPADAPAATPAATPAPPAPPTWSVGPIDFSGVVDVYADVNFNHPASGNNQLRNFDVKGNQFSLNMAKLTMEHTADPVGFRVDLGFGKAFDIIHATDPAGSMIRNVMQAYVSLKPPKAKGFQLDFGEFYTSAGAEVTETHLNWNYSRSLLYANGPYYHFGVRTTMPVGKYFTGGVQVVNGWNNVEDNNTGKTVGLTAAFATKKVSWFTNYYVGPEKNGTNTGERNFIDTVLLLTPNDKFAFNLNYDYGQDKRIGEGKDAFQGISAMAHYTIDQHWSISPRIEWYKDGDGFISGTPQTLKEFTLTGEYKWVEGLLTRLEYRRDWSDKGYFDRGGTPSSAKSQSTILIGFVAYFGPKR